MLSEGQQALLEDSDSRSTQLSLRQARTPEPSPACVCWSLARVLGSHSRVRAFALTLTLLCWACFSCPCVSYLYGSWVHSRKKCAPSGHTLILLLTYSEELLGLKCPWCICVHVCACRGKESLPTLPPHTTDTMCTSVSITPRV